VYIVGGRVFAGKREADEWGITTAEAHGQRIEAKSFGDQFGCGPNTQDRQPRSGDVVPRGARA